MAIFLDAGQQGPRAGHDRLRGHASTPGACSPPARQIVGGVTPGKGGRPSSSTARRAGVRLGRRGDRGDRRRRLGRLRAGRVHQGRGRSRRSTPASRWSSSSPRASRCTTRPRSSSTRRTRAATRIIGPNCPGLISPGQSNAGIIPADITRPGRIGLVSKSGTLTYQMMYELRDIGFSTARRHRRRPGHRHDAHRLPRGVPGRPGDRRHRDDRRDRRRRRGARRGVHQGERHQAGRRLRRRLHRSRGQDDGPRRRDRLRLVRHRAAKKEALEAAGVKVGKTPSETARLMREVMASL